MFGWLTKPPKERRRSVRIPVACLEAIYWDGATNASHILREVSFDGAAIETEVMWYEGTLIRLAIRKIRANASEPAPENYVQMWCRVVRRIATGFCVEFLFPTMTDRRSFAKFLEQNHVKPYGESLKVRKRIWGTDSA